MSAMHRMLNARRMAKKGSEIALGSLLFLISIKDSYTS